MFQGCVDQKKANTEDKRQTPSFAQNAPNQTDDMIASAFKELSHEERERNYYEMHGVADDIEETAEFVTKSLHDLQEAVLQLIRIEPKLAKAYLFARKQNSQYVTNRLLRIRFLRSEYFVPKQSATRMFRWFDWKRELFGNAKLCKEIGYDDLMPEDIVTLRKGYFQRLPVRDRVGRTILVAIQDNQVYASAESLGRIQFYMMVQRIEEPCEMGDIVLVFHPKRPTLATLDPRITAMYAKVASCLPTRHVAFHHCISDGSGILVKLFMSSVMKHMESQTRAKIKIHAGSNQEIMYSIMTYGLPHHRAIPLSENGIIKTKAHLEWLEMRKVRDYMASTGRRDMIDLPLNSDILLGRGRPIQAHMGNLRLQAIIDEYVPIYFRSTKEAKTILGDDIVKRVKDKAGSRFLSKENGIWLEVSDEAAREKVRRLLWTRKDLTPSTTNTGQRNLRRSQPDDNTSESRTPEEEAETERFEQLQPATKRWRM